MSPPPARARRRARGRAPDTAPDGGSGTGAGGAPAMRRGAVRVRRPGSRRPASRRPVVRPGNSDSPLARTDRLAAHRRQGKCLVEENACRSSIYSSARGAFGPQFHSKVPIGSRCRRCPECAEVDFRPIPNRFPGRDRPRPVRYRTAATPLDRARYPGSWGRLRTCALLIGRLNVHLRVGSCPQTTVRANSGSSPRTRQREVASVSSLANLRSDTIPGFPSFNTFNIPAKS